MFVVGAPMIRLSFDYLGVALPVTRGLGLPLLRRLEFLGLWGFVFRLFGRDEGLDGIDASSKTNEFIVARISPSPLVFVD